MTAHRIPLPDWRDNTRGMPIALFDGKTIKPMSTGIDKETQSHVERIGERKQVKRETKA